MIAIWEDPMSPIKILEGYLLKNVNGIIEAIIVIMMIVNKSFLSKYIQKRKNKIVSVNEDNPRSILSKKFITFIINI
jgi:hypothetical protein